VLGAAIGPGNGCPVLEVKPDGPAAKAGIQPLDRLGKPSDCASALYGFFRPGKDARTVEWMVRRPKAESPGADGRDAEGEQEEASA
jgi:S1-C subfamily serine protease